MLKAYEDPNEDYDEEESSDESSASIEEIAK